MSKEQKYAIADFGDAEGVDIVETVNIEYPAARRCELNNDDFEFGQELVYVSRVQSKKAASTSSASGSGSVQRYAMKVLKFGDTKAELKPGLDRLVQGKDLEGSESPLGRGKRSVVPPKRILDSESDSDEEYIPPSKKEKKQRQKAVAMSDKQAAEKLVKQLVERRKSAGPNEQETIAKLQAENAAVRQEVKALTTALALSKELPALLSAVQSLCKDAQQLTTVATGSRGDCGSKVVTPPPPPPTKKEPQGAKPKTEPKVQWDLIPDGDLTCNGQVLLPRKEVRMLPHESPRAVVNALMTKVFGREMLAQHSLTGGTCHAQKDYSRPSLPGEQVAAIRDFVRTAAPGYSEKDFKRHAREKMSNARKQEGK